MLDCCSGTARRRLLPDSPDDEPPMPDTPLPGLADPQLLPLLETLGQPDFFEQFLHWLHQQLLTDQCMLFFCANDQQVSTLLYRDFSADISARQLALAYISERQYLHDPNFERLRQCQPGQIMTQHLQELLPTMGLAYQKRFFAEPGFEDKWSILFRADNGRYYLNLYSRRGNFRQHLGAQESACARLLATLISKHYLLNQALLSQGTLAFLSERERQVCEATLAGKKAEAIAHELGVAASSIVTYRKRAYEKLGISSRAQLFALCR